MSEDDYRWEHMSVMERCEVLRAQVHRLMKANGWVHPDSTLKVDMCPNNEGIPKASCPSCSPTELELARLRRIEAAAREAMDQWRVLTGIPGWKGLHDLMASLDSEPER